MILGIAIGIVIGVAVTCAAIFLYIAKKQGEDPT